MADILKGPAAAPDPERAAGSQLAICDGPTESVGEEVESLGKLKMDNTGKTVKVGLSEFTGVEQVFIDTTAVWLVSAQAL